VSGLVIGGRSGDTRLEPHFHTDEAILIFLKILKSEA